MSTQKQQFLTPVGRLVQGDPFEKQTKNMQGQPLMTQAGAPTQRYFVAVAFSKSQCPEFGAFYQLLVGVARGAFPQLFNAQGVCTHPRFSWKLIDGDGVDDNGKPNSGKEGFAGNWVVKFQSSFPPRCFYQGRYQPQDEIRDPNVIRRGYYVRVSGTIEGNGNAQKPGLYVNLGMVELAAQGPEISSGPDAASVFGASPAPALPAGATAFPSAATPGAPGMTYTAPAMPGMPQMPGMPAAPTFPGAGVASPPPVAPLAPAATQAMMPGTPQTPAMPGMPQVAVAPNPAFAAGPGAQPAMPGLPAMPAMPQPAAPAVPQLTPGGAATGFTYAQFQAAGWGDAQLRQAGYIV